MLFRIVKKFEGRVNEIESSMLDNIADTKISPVSDINVYNIWENSWF